MNADEWVDKVIETAQAVVDAYFAENDDSDGAREDAADELDAAVGELQDILAMPESRDV